MIARAFVIVVGIVFGGIIAAKPAAAQAIVINPGSLPNGTVGLPYNQTLVANDSDNDDVAGSSDPDDQFSYTVTAGTLPTGLILNLNNGTLSGTPSVGGSYSFTVQAADFNSPSNTGTQNYTINIGTNSLVLSPATLPNATQGVVYSQTVSASGGSGSYTYSISAGSLPAGMSLNPSTGAVTGIPTGSGPANFTIQALDTLGNIGSQAYSINVGTQSLTISPPTLPAGTVGAAYNQAVSASGGTGPYTYSITSGNLPTGLNLASNSGAITGTPSATGQFIFTVQAVDSSGNSGSQSYAVNIGSSGTLTIAPSTLPVGTIGTAYSQTVSASGGSGPYTYAVTTGSLPNGLTLSSGGVLSGTPSGPAGAANFTVTATDSVGNTGTHPYTLNIGTAGALAIAPATLPPGTKNVPYSQTVSASGGTGPYTYSKTAGNLPAGLSLNASTGAITGTPTGNGVSNFTIQALDSLGNTGTRAYTVNVGTASLTVNPPTLPATVAGKPYSQTVSATGGTGPYTFSVVGGTLPPGLSLNAATGVISGTPTALGNANFTIQALDSQGNIGTRAYALVGRPDPALDPEVTGLVTSQVATAQRFAFAQVSNVERHLESLHDQFNPCSFNFGIAPPTKAPLQSYGAVPPGYADPNALYSPYTPYGAGHGVTGAPPQQRPQQVRRPGEEACAADWMSSLAFWTAGSVQFGTMTPNGVTSSDKFMSSGVTGGVDMRMT